MEIKPIKTKADYRAALKEIETLMSARAAAEGERLDVLVTLVEAYEKKHVRLDLPDAVEAIKFRMEQSGLMPKDLVPMIGQIRYTGRVAHQGVGEAAPGLDGDGVVSFADTETLYLLLQKQSRSARCGKIKQRATTRAVTLYE